MFIKKDLTQKEKRHRRIRKKIIGTDDKPRLSIYRSLNHLYAQLINDITGKTILFLSTNSKEFKKVAPSYGNIKAAEALGERFANLAISKGVKEVVFDKGGYPYHGRIKAFAESARKTGLQF
ncbi:MAG: 50S ribosomal protein L18 [Candidatus Omnitrophica bacterium]|nr:50S ribosomal protein L18 [Candidatus Omnitrophota bacterium]